MLHPASSKDVAPITLTAIKLLSDLDRARDVMFRQLLGKTYKPTYLRVALLRQLIADLATAQKTTIRRCAQTFGFMASISTIRTEMEGLVTSRVAVAMQGDKGTYYKPVLAVVDGYNKRMRSLAIEAAHALEPLRLEVARLKADQRFEGSSQRQSRNSDLEPSTTGAVVLFHPGARR